MVVQKGKLYRHSKSKGIYQVLELAKMQAKDWFSREEDPLASTFSSGLYYNSVDMEDVVVYQSIVDGRVWVRPINEFEARFDTEVETYALGVDHE